MEIEEHKKILAECAKWNYNKGIENTNLKWIRKLNNFFNDKYDKSMGEFRTLNNDKCIIVNESDILELQNEVKDVN
jgi:hypothetical protein